MYDTRKSLSESLGKGIPGTLEFSFDTAAVLDRGTKMRLYILVAYRAYSLSGSRRQPINHVAISPRVSYFKLQLYGSSESKEPEAGRGRGRSVRVRTHLFIAFRSHFTLYEYVLICLLH